MNDQKRLALEVAVAVHETLATAAGLKFPVRVVIEDASGRKHLVATTESCEMCEVLH